MVIHFSLPHQELRNFSAEKTISEQEFQDIMYYNCNLALQKIVFLVYSSYDDGELFLPLSIFFDEQMNYKNNTFHEVYHEFVSYIGNTRRVMTRLNLTSDLEELETQYKELQDYVKFLTTNSEELDIALKKAIESMPVNDNVLNVEFKTVYDTIKHREEVEKKQKEFEEFFSPDIFETV